MQFRSQDNSISSYNRRKACRVVRKWGRKQDLGHQKKPKTIVITAWPTACPKILPGAALCMEVILINWVWSMVRRLAMFVQGYRVSSLWIQGLALKEKNHPFLVSALYFIHTLTPMMFSNTILSPKYFLFSEIACHVCKAIQQTSVKYELKAFEY